MASLGDKLEEAFGEIAQDETLSYCSKPIPHELDAKLSRVAKLFIESCPTERTYFFRLTHEDISFRFICFAERMATVGVREKSRQRLLEGLAALIIEDYRVDWRDNLTRLAPLYDAATKIGVSPDELFIEAASLADNSVARAITEFTKRKPEDKSLEAFEYEEVNEPNGFRYKSKW